jgi:hypothetical protein
MDGLLTGVDGLPDDDRRSCGHAHRIHMSRSRIFDVTFLSVSEPELLLDNVIVIISFS